MKILRHFSVLLFVFASQISNAQDCTGPVVGFGEIMAGLQAGFTGGSKNDDSIPSGFYLGVSGIDQRGFIDPETGSGWKCESDWGLVSAWFGASLDSVWVTTVGDARKLAENWVAVRILVDGVEHLPVEPAVKIGTIPLSGSEAALKTWGVLFEPHSLSPGTHSAEVFFRVDSDCLFSECDGEYETYLGSVDAEFEVLSD